MPEKIARLRATIDELEAELAALSEVDEATRDILQEAVREIQEALGEPRQLEHHSLADRLREAADDFETSHPTLFGIVRRTIDALAQMGI